MHALIYQLSILTLSLSLSLSVHLSPQLSLKCKTLGRKIRKTRSSITRIVWNSSVVTMRESWELHVGDQLRVYTLRRYKGGVWNCERETKFHVPLARDDKKREGEKIKLGTTEMGLDWEVKYSLEFRIFETILRLTWRSWDYAFYRSTRFKDIAQLFFNSMRVTCDFPEISRRTSSKASFFLFELGTYIYIYIYTYLFQAARVVTVKKPQGYSDVSVFSG